MFRTAAAVSAFALLAAPAFAEAEKYTIDPSHSQIVFTYNHLGYSTTTSMFSGFEGEIMFDQANPEASSVSVSFPANSMITGWDARTQHFMTADFFDPAKDQTVSFKSTAIKVTGDKEADITGDLTINGVTKSVVIDAELNQAGEHPMEKKMWAGFSGEITILRSDFGLGAFTPFIGDEINIDIEIEAAKAE
ncbi:YceI family protein [Xinfangfangia sp. CPCC 101601]|uniref:YceI family protein n=1 Tax=Pseudogemmobacter lacusdianii TaxID=3069608 RepID=A0ABU0W125_9RHOB|nr:YceI family protein [Xinfangfangia sp. CPCC 101601]MDQ2067714.1 YceI family protein [Xinfangfangia sp. CPCC 101601]